MGLPRGDACLALAGVVLFRGNGWRTGALLVAAVALSLALLDAFAGLLAPTAYGAGLVRKVDPQWWPQPHPVLGFRPKPDSTAVATATFNGLRLVRDRHVYIDPHRASRPKARQAQGSSRPGRYRHGG